MIDLDALRHLANACENTIRNDKHGVSLLSEDDSQLAMDAADELEALRASELALKRELKRALDAHATTLYRLATSLDEQDEARLEQLSKEIGEQE